MGTGEVAGAAGCVDGLRYLHLESNGYVPAPSPRCPEGAANSTTLPSKPTGEASLTLNASRVLPHAYSRSDSSEFLECTHRGVMCRC